MNYQVFAKTASLSIAALGLLGGCLGAPAGVESGEEPTEPAADMAFDEISFGDGEASSAPPPIVAEIAAPDGARLIFINEGEPGEEAVIGVEIVSAAHTPWTDAVLAQNPSALELFLAAAPGVEGPDELLRDHQRLAVSGEHAAAPRALEGLQATGETSSDYNCYSPEAWAGSFDEWAPELAGEYIEPNEYGNTIGYVGYASKFYFDVCSPYSPPVPARVGSSDVASHTGFFIGVYRRAGSSYSWSLFNTDTNPFEEKGWGRWRYYRNTNFCSSYQYRLVVDTAYPAYPYRRAARWSHQWPCEFTRY